MTDARFPDYWMQDARIQGLSGDHFRAFMHTLAWSAHNRTDGHIRAENLALIHRLDDGAVSAFVAAGLCAEVDDGWLIIDYLATQTTRAQFEANERTRAKDRERKAKERAEKLAAQQGVRMDVRTDVRTSFPGRQAGRLLSKETKDVSSDPQTTFDEPPDDDEPPPEDDYRPGEYEALKRKADENVWRSYDR